MARHNIGLLAILIAAILLAGCVGGQPPASNATSGQGGQATVQPAIPGPGVSAADAQRQQAVQAMAQKAIDACKGAGIGASCTVQTQNGSITGACQKGISGALICIPQAGGKNP